MTFTGSTNHVFSLALVQPKKALPRALSLQNENPEMIATETKVTCDVRCNGSGVMMEPEQQFVLLVSNMRTHPPVARDHHAYVLGIQQTNCKLHWRVGVQVEPIDTEQTGPGHPHLDPIW